MRGRTVGLALLSVAVHVAVPAVLISGMPERSTPLRAEHGMERGALHTLGVPVAPWGASGPPAGIRAELWAERAQLVARARAARRADELELGAFVIEANRLDALERGRSLDVATIQLRYSARVRALREASPDRPLSEIVPEVFEDIAYIGRPGGLMSDVLMEGGGACEPLSHLVVAALFDAGHADRLALRYYGGVGRAGVRHLAPLDVGGETPIDLMVGAEAAPGGVQFGASDLIEVYARAHGMPAAPLGGHTAAGVRAPPNGPSPLRAGAELSMESGYPKNVDAHPSGMPLYSTRAFGSSYGAGSAGHPGSASAGEEVAEGAPEPQMACLYGVRISALDPLRWTAHWPAPDGSTESVQIEPRKVPPATRLADYAERIRGAEDAANHPDATAPEQLMSIACLVALYERAAVDFALLGEHELARIASQSEEIVRDRGTQLLQRAWTDASAEEREALAEELSQRFPSHTWLLLLLEGGEDLVRSSPEGSMHTKNRGWGSILTLAALVVNPSTRARTLADLSQLGRKEQIEVMHEIFRAHGDMGQGTSAFVLQDPDEHADTPRTEFARAYRVFRRLAWRLWGGGRSFEELTTALHRELTEEGLGAEWEAPMLTYYLNYVIGLLHYREDGLTVLVQLDALIRKRPELNIDPLRKRVKFLLAKQRVDPKAVAEAFRKQPD